MEYQGRLKWRLRKRLLDLALQDQGANLFCEKGEPVRRGLEKEKVDEKE